MFELICCYCGDDPDLGYRDVSPVAGAPVTGADFCSVYPDLCVGLAMAIYVVVILPTGGITSPLVMTIGVGGRGVAGQVGLS